MERGADTTTYTSPHTALVELVLSVSQHAAFPAQEVHELLPGHPPVVVPLFRKHQLRDARRLRWKT